MSEQYPYPAAEHYVFPRTRADIIADEIKYYPEPEEFRDAVVGLSELYAETPVMKAMHKYAFLVNVAHVAAGGESRESRIDADFCMGTLLAVHSTVREAPQSLRMRVFKFDPMHGIDGNDDDREDRIEIVKYLHAWQVQGFEEKFDEVQPELQEGLFDLTKHIYHGTYNTAERLEKEQSFMSGYMFAINIIDSNLQTSGPV